MAEERKKENPKIRRLLALLGDAIGESVSSSPAVHEVLRRIREEGQHVYVMLDARIGVDPDRRRAYEAAKREKERRTEFPNDRPDRARLSASPEPGYLGDFRMNIGDALFLRQLGIDGTLRIRRARSRSPLVPDEPGR